MFLVNIQKLFSSDVIKSFKELEDDKKENTWYISRRYLR
jgi:hypothetical protein